jgi:transcriptional regulator with XRE-family HTH domain
MNNKIKQARQELGYTHQKVADKLGISALHYSRLENDYKGCLKKISIETFIKLCKVLKIKPSEVLE